MGNARTGLEPIDVVELKSTRSLLNDSGHWITICHGSSLLRLVGWRAPYVLRDDTGNTRLTRVAENDARAQNADH